MLSKTALEEAKTLMSSLKKQGLNPENFTTVDEKKALLSQQMTVQSLTTGLVIYLVYYLSRHLLLRKMVTQLLV